MKKSMTHPWLAAAGVVALSFTGLGCATKGYVNKTVDPLDTRVGEVEKQTADNSTKITDLESQVGKDISRLDERSLSNSQKVAEVGERATRAGQRADEAVGLAEEGLAGVNGLREGLEQVVEGLDNYQMVSQETVLFPFNSNELGEDAKAKLDEAAGRIDGMNRYVIEIRGFTDTSGSPQYNLDLSRRRADAVVRYLTSMKNIPLHRIHLLGLGSEAPTADNKTRDGRKQNRRVELKVFVADVEVVGTEESTTAAAAAASH